MEKSQGYGPLAEKGQDWGSKTLLCTAAVHHSGAAETWERWTVVDAKQRGVFIHASAESPRGADSVQSGGHDDETGVHWTVKSRSGYNGEKAITEMYIQQ